MDPSIVLALHLMSLTLADQQQVILNPDHIVTARPLTKDEEHLAPVQCIIHFDDARWIGVLEDCQKVRTLFNRSQSE
jgi:hypothetical protein